MKKIRKKKALCNTVAALLACSTVFSLASCKVSNNNSTPDNSVSGVVFNIPEGGYDGSKQTVTFYHTMGKELREVLDEAIANFKTLYPNIEIKASQVGKYNDVLDKISLELTVGDHPSMAYCYSDHVALYNMYSAVITLDNLIESEIEITNKNGTEPLGFTQDQLDDFIPGYYEEGRAYGDGLMYTLPMSKSTELLYYNKTFFEENELEVPKTWDEMEILCQKILTIDKNCIPLGYDSESNWFITMCEQQGSPYTSSDPNNRYLFDDEDNYEFVARYSEWFAKGYVTTQALYGAYTSKLFTAQNGQKAYMCIGSSAGAKNQRPLKNTDGRYPFEVGVATIPQVNPEKPKVISQGPSLCIFDNKNNPQEVVASWLFTKYLTSNVLFQADFASVSGYVPVIKSVENDQVYSQMLASADGFEFLPQLAIKACLDQSNAYFASPAFNGSSIARQQVEYLMKACLADAANNKDKVADMKYIKDKFAYYVGRCNYLS